MNIQLFTVTLTIAALAGCASGPPSGSGPTGQLTAQDFGPRPDDPDGLVRAQLARTLKDPYSMVLERKAGPRTFTKKGSLLGPGSFGWGVCYTVNAKNAYGGYVGARPVFYVIREDRIVDTMGEMGGNSIDASMATAACGNLGVTF